MRCKHQRRSHKRHPRWSTNILHPQRVLLNFGPLLQLALAGRFALLIHGLERHLRMNTKEYQEALEQLSPEDKELTENLTRRWQAYTGSRKAFMPSLEDINKRAKKKDISFNEARREVLREIRPLQDQMANTALKLMKPNLSKGVRKKLGIREVGRPAGSKNKAAKTSKADFYKRLRQLAISKNQRGEELKIKEAAIGLGLGGERQLRKRLREYGDARKWKAIVVDLLT